MPPSNQPPFDPTDHLLPPGRKSSVGSIVGIIIIVALLLIGAFYFWGAHLNSQNSKGMLPLIPGNSIQ